MPGSPDLLDLLAASDPVAAFWQAHADGRLIGLRTSGTSAAPRWVVRTTSSWVSSFASFAKLAGVDSSSRCWIPGPLSSTMNLFANVQASASGCAVVDDPAVATHAHLTPAALDRAIDIRHLAPGTAVVVAGDLLRPALRVRALDAGLRVHHYYGASELSFVAWGTAADDLRAFPGVEIEVRHDEIWARSDYVSEGYAHEGIRCADGPFLQDADGWATVGDRGALHGGVLDVHGRGSDFVTTAGATIWLADVESVLRRHARGEVILTGVPHERLGAILVAAVTDPQDAAALAVVARTQLPPAQRPRRWFHMRSVPMTAAGKADRAGLAALLAGELTANGTMSQ